MFVRLLTCLALITGLAAADAPANAAAMDVLSEQVSTSSAASPAGNAAQIDCAARPASSPAKGERVIGRKADQSIAIVIPTVYIGVDRAYE